MVSGVEAENRHWRLCPVRDVGKALSFRGKGRANKDKV